MATVEDVKRFVYQHAGDTFESVVGRVAREFGLKRDQAARMVSDIASEAPPAPAVGDLPPRAVWAEEVEAGFGGTFPTGTDHGPGYGHQQGGGADAAGLAASKLGEGSRDTRNSRRDDD